MCHASDYAHLQPEDPAMPAYSTAAEYDQVRVGSTEHWSQGGLRTLCGISLAGTPVAPVSRGFCETCQRRLPCDECGHAGEHSHLWAPALEERYPEAGRYTYQHATCWAENICRYCAPEQYVHVVMLLPEAEQQAYLDEPEDEAPMA